MPVVISLSEVISDDWIRIDDNSEIDEPAQIIVSRQRLQRDWTDLQKSGFILGLELEVTDAVEEFAGYLSRLDLIVLNFEVFADGRAFSQARLLRERMDYFGDIRAQGNVLRDQLSFMHRCGFTQFQLADAEGEEVRLALNAFSDISHSYQPELAIRTSISDK